MHWPTTMTYKGYAARVKFDERDDIFVGRVLGLRTIISFHGNTVARLRIEFKVAVDEFLKDCRKRGISPEPLKSGEILLRRPKRQWRGLVKYRLSP